MINASRARAGAPLKPDKPATQSTGSTEGPRPNKGPVNPFQKNKTGARPANRRPNSNRWKRNKPQAPAKRTKKLHRGKYMEFKYDCRAILDTPEVAEEHRSNILGQVWAKGERTGVEEAKNFLDEKIAEGILTESVSKAIKSLIDELTTKR